MLLFKNRLTVLLSKDLKRHPHHSMKNDSRNKKTRFNTQVDNQAVDCIPGKNFSTLTCEELHSPMQIRDKLRIRNLVIKNGDPEVLVDVGVLDKLECIAGASVGSISR